MTNLQWEVHKTPKPKMHDWHSNHNVSKLGYHIVWCPKYRKKVITDSIAIELKTILVQTSLSYGWHIHEIEVMEDHIHLFIQAPSDVSPQEISKTLKSISAVHIFHKFPELKGKHFWGSGFWSRGSYYASVGSISEEAIRHYIQNQKAKCKTDI